MKTLYLHAGTHKTATSLIQRFCADNSDILNKKGYDYPLLPFRYLNRSANRNGLFLGFPVRDTEHGKRDLDEEKRRFDYGIQMIHDSFEKYDNVIISDEAMWKALYRRDNFTRKLLEDRDQQGYTIKVIIYLRRQDQFIESMWNQRVKTESDFKWNLDTYLENYKYLNYYEILSKFGDLFGDDNICVRRYLEITKGEGILADFLHLVGLELTDDFRQQERIRNIGLYGNNIRIKELINDVDDLTYSEQRLFISSLNLTSLKARKTYPCSEFSPAERTEFMKEFEADNARIVDRFIGDGLPLFSTDYDGPPKRQDHNPVLLDDSIRAAAATDLTLFRHHNRLKETVELQNKRIKKLEKQIKDLEERNRTSEKYLNRIRRRHNWIRHPFRSLAKKLSSTSSKDK